jgi:dihydrofolate reductase
MKITIHMVASLDGIIAKKDNSVGWFETTSPYEKGSAGENPEEFLKTIDCYIMGAKTYEHGAELAKTYGWAYGETPTIVLTHRELPRVNESIRFYSGSLKELIDQRLRPSYSNIWVVGGPSVAKDFIQGGLANEIRMSILPIILGDGLPFFDHLGIEQPLRLNDVTAYKNGIVELRYEIKI